MNNPIQSTILSQLKLNPQRYFETLFDAATTLGLIDCAKVHRELYTLLTNQCRAYTGGNSASLRKETVESISESILFTLGIQLKSAVTPLDSLAMLENCGVESCYRSGRKRIDRQIQSTELFYRSMLINVPDIPNEIYRDTLYGGISGFFKLYNPEYGAHLLHITADYPVIFYPEGWRGIEFIRIYLKNLQFENQFISLFDFDRTSYILSTYASGNGCTLKTMFSNLYIIMLSAALLQNDFNIDRLFGTVENIPEDLRAYVRRTAETENNLIQQTAKVLASAKNLLF